MQSQQQTLIIFILFTTAFCGDFYFPGWRYYNSDKCVGKKFLDYFTFGQDPMKNLDQMIRMTYTNDQNYKTNYAAYISSKDKAGLADSHEFFKIVKNMNKQEREYFPQYVVCIKDVYFFLIGFGSLDSYGLVYRLNPTIHEYTSNSVRGKSNFDFYDLFTVYLDIFRGYKDMANHSYYLKEVTSADVGVSLEKGQNGDMELQGSIRRLHQLRKGKSNSYCDFKKISNYEEHLEKFIENIGSNNIPLNGISTCNNLNISAFLDEFFKNAAQAVEAYHEEKDADFEYCFEENLESYERCPEPMKPIWGNSKQRELMRKIRNSVLKYTTETILDHLIETFETLRDRELSRIAEIERKLLEETRRNKELALQEAERRKQKLIELMKVAIIKLKMNAKVQINDEEDELIRKREGLPERIKNGPKAAKLAGLIKKHLKDLKNYQSPNNKSSIPIQDASYIESASYKYQTAKTSQKSKMSLDESVEHIIIQRSQDNSSNFEYSKSQKTETKMIHNQSNSQSGLNKDIEEVMNQKYDINRRRSKIEMSNQSDSKPNHMHINTNPEFNNQSGEFNYDHQIHMKKEDFSQLQDSEDISYENPNTRMEHKIINRSQEHQDISIHSKTLPIELVSNSNSSNPLFVEKSIVLQMDSSTSHSNKNSSSNSSSSKNSSHSKSSSSDNSSNSSHSYSLSQTGKVTIPKVRKRKENQSNLVIDKTNYNISQRHNNSADQISHVSGVHGKDYEIDELQPNPSKKIHSKSTQSGDINKYENILNKKLQEDRQKVVEELKKVIQKKIKTEESIDTDEDINRAVQEGIVSNPKLKIIENEQISLDQEKHKDLLIQMFKKSLKHQIDAVTNEETRELEIKKLDSVLEIMDMKKEIDKLREGPQNSSNERVLDEKINNIGAKIDKAIAKYGSDMELFDSQQVPITLGGLKRELDPYYLKIKQSSHGSLTPANQNNEFIFLV